MPIQSGPPRPGQQFSSINPPSEGLPQVVLGGRPRPGVQRSQSSAPSATSSNTPNRASPGSEAFYGTYNNANRTPMYQVTPLGQQPSATAAAPVGGSPYSNSGIVFGSPNSNSSGSPNANVPASATPYNQYPNTQQANMAYNWQGPSVVEGTLAQPSYNAPGTPRNNGNNGLAAPLLPPLQMGGGGGPMYNYGGGPGYMPPNLGGNAQSMIPQGQVIQRAPSTPRAGSANTGIVPGTPRAGSSTPQPQQQQQSALIRISMTEVKAFAQMFGLHEEIIKKVLKQTLGDRDQAIIEFERLSAKLKNQRSEDDANGSAAHHPHPSDIDAITRLRQEEVQNERRNHPASGSFSGGSPGGGSGSGSGGPAPPPVKLEFGNMGTVMSVLSVLGIDSPSTSQLRIAILAFNKQKGNADNATTQLLEDGTLFNAPTVEASTGGPTAAATSGGYGHAAPTSSSYVPAPQIFPTVHSSSNVSGAASPSQAAHTAASNMMSFGPLAPIDKLRALFPQVPTDELDTALMLTDNDVPNAQLYLTNVMGYPALGAAPTGLAAGPISTGMEHWSMRAPRQEGAQLASGGGLGFTASGPSPPTSYQYTGASGMNAVYVSSNAPPVSGSGFVGGVSPTPATATHRPQSAATTSAAAATSGGSSWQPQARDKPLPTIPEEEEEGDAFVEGRLKYNTASTVAAATTSTPAHVAGTPTAATPSLPPPPAKGLAPPPAKSAPPPPPVGKAPPPPPPAGKTPPFSPPENTEDSPAAPATIEGPKKSPPPLPSAGGKAPPPPPPPGKKGAPPPPPPPGKAGAKAHGGDSSAVPASHIQTNKTKALFWQKLAADPTTFEKTVWATGAVSADDPVANADEMAVALSPDELEKLQAIFSKKTTPAQVKDAAANANKEGKIEALDATREKNIGIVLQFIRLPLDTIETAVKCMDRLTLSVDTISGLISISPTPEDLKRAAVHQKIFDENRNTTKLSNPTKFVLMAGSIPRFQQRLQCWYASLVFEEEAAELSERLMMIKSTLECAISSQKFPVILQYILSVGNFLNAGTQYRDAKGFKMSDLPNITATKTSDGKSTMLSYLVSLIENKNPESHQFVQELAPLQKVASSAGDLAKLDLAQLGVELQELRTKTAQCGVLIKALQKEPQTADNNTVIQTLTTFNDIASPALTDLTKRVAELQTSTVIRVGEYYGEDVSKGTVDIQSLIKNLGLFVRDYEAELKSVAERNERKARMASGAATTTSGAPARTPRNGTALPGLNLAATSLNAGGSTNERPMTGRTYGVSDKAFEDLL